MLKLKIQLRSLILTTPLNNVRLVGQHVSLVALNPGEHAAPLHAASHGAQKDKLWHYLRDGPFADAESHRAHLERLCRPRQFVGFAIVGPVGFDASSRALFDAVASEELVLERIVSEFAR
jgi:hypothetical protein